MKGKKIIVSLILIILSAGAVFGNGIRKETYTYAVKGNDTLRMDKYDIPDGEVKPCVIFMFGGGFFTGSRDRELYVNYMNFLVDNGFTAISIDYRLGFKDFQAPEKKLNGREFIALLESVIHLAVVDLYDATNFVLDNAEEWNIDPTKIVTSGSSAGAVSILQAEYERCNRTVLAEVLPEDFKYAGVVAFAGAIYSNTGKLTWNDTPAPMQMFHGDADKNVPFGTMKMLGHGFLGSESIAKSCDKNGFPYYFYIEENANHRIAGTPMTSEHEEILSFLKKYVLEEQNIQTRVVVSPVDAPKMKKKFGVMDYVKANFVGEP